MDPPRIWNHLVDELNLNTDSLSSFKSAMFIYYISSLYSTCYDVEDPRSFTAICPVRSGILFVVPQRHNGKCTAWDLVSRSHFSQLGSFVVVILKLAYLCLIICQYNYCKYSC
jgi:hypothetical protein